MARTSIFWTKKDPGIWIAHLFVVPPPEFFIQCHEHVWICEYTKDFEVQIILQNLKKETASKTTIIISHRTSTLEKSDNIIVIDKGKIIEEGSHSTLIKNQGFYSQIHVNQSNN